MLVLSRKVGERLFIGDNVVITITEIRGDKVRIGVEAPRDVRVLRQELKDENEADPHTVEGPRS
jgi:carbon storage regulator